MIEIQRRKFIFFRTKEIWFADYPFDFERCDGVTFYECPSKIVREGFEMSEFPTLVIDLTQGSDCIWKNMDKRSCRYPIQRGIREGIDVRIDEDFEEFSRMNISFRKRKGLAGMRNLKEMKGDGILFTARLRGELLAGQFYLKDSDHMRWLLGASKRLETEKETQVLIGCANRMIIWEAIKYGKRRGLREFNLGGLPAATKNSDLRGIADFKKSFGGRFVLHYTYGRNYSRAYAIVNMLKKMFYG